jgi:hypothetical protein
MRPCVHENRKNFHELWHITRRPILFIRVRKNLCESVSSTTKELGSHQPLLGQTDQRNNKLPNFLGSPSKCIQYFLCRATNQLVFSMFFRHKKILCSLYTTWSEIQLCLSIHTSANVSDILTIMPLYIIQDLVLFFRNLWLCHYVKDSFLKCQPHMAKGCERL